MRVAFGIVGNDQQIFPLSVEGKMRFARNALVVFKIVETRSVVVEQLAFRHVSRRVDYASALGRIGVVFVFENDVAFAAEVGSAVFVFVVPGIFACACDIVMDLAD